MELQLLHSMPVELLLNILDDIDGVELMYLYNTDRYIQNIIHDNTGLLLRYYTLRTYVSSLKSNFNSTQLEYLRLIKDKYLNKWNDLLRIKSKLPVTIHQFLSVLSESGFDSSTSRVVPTKIVIFLIRETNETPYDVYITDISGLTMGNVGSGYISHFSTLGFSELENGIAIYLDQQQIQLLSNEMFNYI